MIYSLVDIKNMCLDFDRHTSERHGRELYEFVIDKLGKKEDMLDDDWADKVNGEGYFTK